jgi:serine/threonine protein kinase
MVPAKVGDRYEVRSAIGQGGFGTVWLARDTLLGRDVAMKQVGLMPGRSVTDSVRALREARNSAALSHRNVVTVFDVVDDGGLWLVMEYVPSESLARLIEREGRLSADRVAEIGAQVADGLAAAHAAGTVHRDVKPANILVRPDGTAKLTDFGIARNAADPALTQTGLITGTPQYFAPELARGGDPTPASDVWALGATLYAAVEGRPLVEPRENPMAVLHAIVEKRPQRPLHAGPLEAVLRGMLDRDPANRWSTRKAAERLRQTIAGPATEPPVSWPSHDDPPTRTLPFAAQVLTKTAPPHSPTPPRSPGAPPPVYGSGHGRRRPRVLVAGLLAVATTVGVALLVADGYQGDPTAGAAGDRSTASSATADPTREASSPDAAGSAGRTTTPDDIDPSEGTGLAIPPQEAEPATPSPSRQATGGGGEDAVRFLATYYATATTDPTTGFAQLTPAMQQQTDSASYEAFWGDIESVETSDFTPAGEDMLVTLRYTFRDGRAVEERQRIDLVRTTDGLLIDGDEVISSRTVGR